MIRENKLKIRRASDHKEKWFSFPSESESAEKWSEGSDCYIAAGQWENQVASEQPELTFNHKTTKL